MRPPCQAPGTHITMATILLPTDFSDPSLRAARYALGLFGVKDHMYILLHAYLDPMPPNPAFPGPVSSLYEASEEGMAMFARRFRALPEAQGAAVRTEVRYGDLAGVVNALYADERVDIVVMSTQGRTGLTLFGSNASELAKHCRAPLLIVPAQAPTPALRNVLFADDHRSVEPLAMRVLVDLLQRTGAGLTIAHVKRAEGEEPDPRIVEAYDEVLRGIPHTYEDGEGEDVALVLNSLVERDAMDLVVVLHRHLGLLDSLLHKSLAKQLAMLSHVPLLVLQH